MRALSLPGCACRGAFQFAVMARLASAGERFDVVAGASSGSVCGAVVVAGLAEEGPAMWRTMASTPIFGMRYLRTEGSLFGMSAILRAALGRFLPEEKILAAPTELLVATAHAGRLAMGALFPTGTGPRRRTEKALVVHSNRARRDMHDVIVASCYIPIVYARLPRLDGEVHVDGGAANNTLIDVLTERGADEITVVTPYPEGSVADTIFHDESPPSVPPHVRLRLIYPERPLTQKRFDFAPGPLEEALTMPHVVKILEPTAAPPLPAEPRREAS